MDTPHNHSVRRDAASHDLLLLQAIICLAAIVAIPAKPVVAASAGVETSSDPSFDQQLFPKLAVIVVEKGGEQTAVSVKKKGAERSTTILFANQTSIERSIEDEFVSALMKKGYTLCTRSDLLSIMKERAVQQLGLTEDDPAGIGKVLKVQAVMLVRFAVHADETGGRPATSKASVAMGARLLSVEGAKILWTGKCSQHITATGVSGSVQAVVMAAKRIASAFPKRSVDVSPPGDKPPQLAARQPVTPSALPSTVANSIGMKLILIPPGEFVMGSAAEPVAPARKQAKKAAPRQHGAVHPEAPTHRVRITRPFYVGIYEVTQAEYERVMGSNPSKFTGNPNRPVEEVTWDNAADFCRRLSELPAEKTKGAVYRLLTEAEWEYCCRAGTTTRYNFGDDAAILSRYAWWSENSCHSTQPVGQLRPNAFGLFDMHGNVWEWCADWYAADYYAKSSAEDPKGPDSGSGRVLRGGSYYEDSPGRYRAAYRAQRPPDSRRESGGFRVATTLTP